MAPAKTWDGIAKTTSPSLLQADRQVRSVLDPLQEVFVVTLAICRNYRCVARKMGAIVISVRPR
jgi:hypothetical protein